MVEFEDVVRRRRMVRSFRREGVERELLDRLLDVALRSPSAGHTQGWAFVVLEGAQTATFWEAASPAEPSPRWARVREAPVVVIPFTDRAAYLRRYAEPDKERSGLDRAAAWPVPYWLVDTSFATMALLLAAADAGLGALFFGAPVDPVPLRAALGVPDGFDPLGAVALGWPDDADVPSPSLRRGWRPRAEVVHYGRFGRP